MNELFIGLEELLMTNVFRKCPGMEFEFVSGKLERDVAERAIFFELTVDLKLDFINFLVMANQFIPNYLESPINAIRPHLAGLAYYSSYKYFGGAAGNIRDSQALFNLFSRSSEYLDEWASDGSMEQRYAKPVFSIAGNTLHMTARQYFRFGVGVPAIEISDLPFIWFQWALDVMLGHTQSTSVAPASIVVLMQAEETLVDVEGVSVFKGTRYLDKANLAFGPILPSQILIA